MIRKKFARATTDSQRAIVFDESRPGVYNLLTIGLTNDESAGNALLAARAHAAPEISEKRNKVQSVGSTGRSCWLTMALLRKRPSDGGVGPSPPMLNCAHPQQALNAERPYWFLRC